MLPISGSCGWEIERYKLCALQFSDSRIIYRAFEPISFHFCWMPVKRREDKLTSQLGAEMEIWLKRRRRRAWLVETQLGDVRHACGNLVRHHIIHLLAANHPMRTTMITWGIFVNAIILVCGQNANRTKCQPDIMPTKGWHFVRTYFCGWHFVRPNFLVGILSGPSQHVLVFCPNHENPP